MHQPIVIVTLGPRGEIVDLDVDETDTVLSLGEAVITLAPNVPPLHTAQFTKWLNQWHRDHNLDRRQP